jgi:Terminase small subunit
MSIHLNADGSQTDGVKVEPWGKFVSPPARLVCAGSRVAYRTGGLQSGRRAGGWRRDAYSGAFHARRHHADDHAWLRDPGWRLDHFERGRRCRGQVHFDVGHLRHDQRRLYAPRAAYSALPSGGPTHRSAGRRTRIQSKLYGGAGLYSGLARSNLSGSRVKPKDTAVRSGASDEWAKNLDDKERLFVEGYLQTLNKREAAEYAGYTPETAKRFAYEIFTRSHVREAIEVLLRTRTGVTKAWLIDKLVAIIDTDLADVSDWDDDGPWCSRRPPT